MTSAREAIARVFGQAAVSAAGGRNIAGDLDTPVTGIAVMAQATLYGLQQAAAQKANLIFSYDPVFWTTGDDLARLETDTLFQEKRDFIRAHGMAAFTFRDHLGQARPDLIAAGMADSLGWTPDAADANLFRRPPTTLLALARALAAKLDDKTLRVVGDPSLRVSTIAASFGNTPQMTGIARLNMADVLVCGYAREWETVEYAQDLISAGVKKGLVLLGENASVQPAIPTCAGWIKSLVTEVPVTFVSLPEPYWNP